LPAIGALGLGLIGFFVPRVLGVGYDTITAILTNRLPLTLLIAVMIFKELALVISLGSGTSGGLLAPMFMSSAAMGAVFAIVMNQVFPGLNLDPGAFALVAMGAVFGAAARATFSFILFAFEVTRNYNAILPLMLVSVIADAIVILVLHDTTIMTMKLERRGLRVPQEYEADALSQVTVEQVMARDIVKIPAEMKVSELADRIARAGNGEPFLRRFHAVPIVDASGNLVGIITQKDVLTALEQDREDLTVLEAGTPSPVVTFPDETVYDAAVKMLRNEVGRLPVVERANPKKLVGYLGRAGVMAARLRRLEEENVREPGWLARWRSSSSDTPNAETAKTEKR